MQHRQWPLGRKAPYYYGMVGGLSIVTIGFSEINSVSCEGSVVAWGGYGEHVLVWASWVRNARLFAEHHHRGGYTRVG